MKHHHKKIHMIGIGGAGMSPLAEVLIHYGYTISGSDKKVSEVTKRLESLGATIQHHHTPELVNDAELVVFSSAIKVDNPERQQATEKNIPQIRRAELLGDLMRAQTTICVSGTHGKTTTTSLIGTLLHNAKCDPTVLVGGMLRESKTHALIGNGRLMVAEADEYDRSFLAMYPTIAVITNIEADHLDCYKDLNEIKQAFLLFTKRVPFYGCVIVCLDDSGVQEILPDITASVVTYGINSNADYTAENVTHMNGISHFDVRERGVTLGTIEMSRPGTHNIRNALAAIAVSRIFNVEFSVIRQAFASFKGVHRRFDIVGVVENVTIVDDYAHHPSELQATIDAARQCGAKRVIAIFQPHLYSRTRDFLNDFVAVLKQADVVYVTDIYQAREAPITNVTASGIVDLIIRKGHGAAFFIADRRELTTILPQQMRKGDYLLFMGAGDIGESAYDLLEALHG